MAGQDVVIRFIAETKGFDLSKLQTELTQTAGYTEALNTGLGSLKAYALAAGGSLLASVLPMVMGSKAVSDYNTNISIATGLNSELAKSADDVNTKVNSWAQTYGLTADDISAGILEMTKAGMDWSQIQADMDPIARLSVANNIDMSDSLEMVVKAQSLWGESTYTSYQYANMLQVAAADSLMDVSDLGDAIKASGSQAAMAGVSYQEFLAAAASLSNIGTELGYNWGTFFTRINTTKDDLATILGDSSWINSDDTVNLTKLLNLLYGASDDQLKAISEKWGGVKTLGAAIQAATIAGKDYSSVLDDINTDTGNLDSTSDQAMQTIQASWTRIQEAIMAPLRDEDVMNAFATSLDTLAAALTSTEYEAAIKNLMLNSAAFVQQYGPQLVGVVINLLELLVQMGPTMVSLASGLVPVLNVLTSIPAPVWEFIAGLYILNKVLPDSTLPLLAELIQMGGGLRSSLTTLYPAVIGIAAGLALVAAGASALSSDDPTIKFFGALAIAAGVATAALSTYIIAKSIATEGSSLPFMAAAAAGAVALLGGVGLSAMTASGGNSLASQNAAVSNVTTGNSSAASSSSSDTITYIDSSTTNNYQASEDDVSTKARAYRGV